MQKLSQLESASNQRKDTPVTQPLKEKLDKEKLDAFVSRLKKDRWITAIQTLCNTDMIKA